MLNDFKRHIKSNFPEFFDQLIYVAVSGGVDSMVLLHLLKELELNPVVLHCNFQLREADSDADEKMVLEVCENLRVKCRSQKFETKEYIEKHKVNVQVAARELRYQWFMEIVQKDGGLLLTAHHQGDFVETFMMNLARGSGIQGLSSIPLRRGYIRRPMSIFSKEQILEYADKNKLVWREDTSNSESKYLRNKLRLEVLPKLDDWYSGFSNNVFNSTRHLSKANHFIKYALKQFKAQRLTEMNDYRKIDLSSYSKQESVLLEMLLQEFGFTTDSIEKIVSLSTEDISKPGIKFESSSFELIVGRNCLEIFEIGIQECEELIIRLDSISTTVQMHGRIVEFSWAEVDDPSTIKSLKSDYLDASKLSSELLLRRVRPGDKMKPLGMKGYKLISDIMIDEKWSASKKRAALVLENNNRIIWLSDFRIAEDFKLKQSSSSVIKLNLH